jgi:DNA-binding CsgD family transcriptional regulator
LALSSQTEAAHAAGIAAQIKQVCCLGLGADAIMPVVARHLQEMIPSYSAMIYTCDKNCEATGFYDLNPDMYKVATVYFNEFYNRRELEVRTGFSETLRTFRGASRRVQTWKVDKRTYQRSDFENLVVRPARYDDFIQLVVRDGDVPKGYVNMPRTYGDRAFSDEELRRLAAIEPFLAHGLVKSDIPMPSAQSDAEGDSGLIIATTSGRMLHISPQARVLLFYFNNPTLVPGKVVAAPSSLPSAVRRMCSNLKDVFEGKAATSPPVFRHSNAQGTFVFRAYWLDGIGAAQSLVGVSVHRQVPLPLKLATHVNKLPLSERQRQTALLMLAGLTYAQIGSQLGVRERTVISHAQEVFNKLGVNGRSELHAYFTGL